MTTGAELAAWAFGSPRRLLALVVVPVAVWVAVDLVGSDDPSRSEAPVVSDMEAANAERNDPEEVASHLGSSPASVAPESQRVVDAFLTAWLDREQPPERWFGALVPYVTPGLADGLRNTDPTRVPNGDVASVRPLQVGEYVGVIEAVLTSGAELQVAVVFDGHEWQVADVESSPP